MNEFNRNNSGQKPKNTKDTMMKGTGSHGFGESESDVLEVLSGNQKIYDSVSTTIPEESLSHINVHESLVNRPFHDGQSGPCSKNSLFPNYSRILDVKDILDADSGHCDSSQNNVIRPDSHYNSKQQKPEKNVDIKGHQNQYEYKQHVPIDIHGLDPAADAHQRNKHNMFQPPFHNNADPKHSSGLDLRKEEKEYIDNRMKYFEQILPNINTLLSFMNSKLNHGKDETIYNASCTYDVNIDELKPDKIHSFVRKCQFYKNIILGQKVFMEQGIYNIDSSRLDSLIEYIKKFIVIIIEKVGQSQPEKKIKHSSSQSDVTDEAELDSVRRSTCADGEAEDRSLFVDHPSSPLSHTNKLNSLKMKMIEMGFMTYNISQGFQNNGESFHNEFIVYPANINRSSVLHKIDDNPCYLKCSVTVSGDSKIAYTIAAVPRDINSLQSRFESLFKSFLS